MRPLAVTFDVAGTLVDARWNPCRVVEDAARRVGLDVVSGEGDQFGQLYAQRLGAFHAANRKSDDAVEAFWIKLDADWLRAIGRSAECARAIYDAGRDMLFGPDAEVFRPFPDAEAAMRRLRARGIRLAAVSNWDNSLPVVLDRMGWSDLFDVVVPSLVFGYEKPDRRIFEHAIQRLGVSATHAFHVGDDPVDDLQGARDAGLRAALVDRSRATSEPPWLSGLDGLEAAFEWTD